MGRAAYYGSKGRYSKAIMNCNEAIKIDPNSVEAYFYRGTLKYQNKVGISSCCRTTAFSLRTQCKRAMLKVILPILLWWLTTSEAPVDSMAVEVELSASIPLHVVVV